MARRVRNTRREAEGLTDEQRAELRLRRIANVADDAAPAPIVQADIVDVTASAGEVNLLDLSALTVGWALIADGPNSASWQAVPHSSTTLQEAYAAGSDPDIQLVGARPVSFKSLSNTDAIVLKLTAQPLATPNIPYVAIEFQASIDLVTSSFNSALIKSGFAAGAGFDKGYLTFCTPVTIGVWNDVLTLRNDRVGIKTNNPICDFHTTCLPSVVLWSDGSPRNTAEYHSVNFTDANLGTGLSGLFGVDNVWTGLNPSGRNVNATFFVLTINGDSFTGPQHHTSMVGQLSIGAFGAFYGNSGVGMQGKIRFTTALATNVTSASLGHTGVEAFLQGSVTQAVTATLLFGFKTRPTIGGNLFTVTNLYHYYVTESSGAGTVVNEWGLYIPNLANATTINQAITLAGDGAGSKIHFGAGQNSEEYYDGTNHIIDPDVVGAGRVLIGVTGDDDMLLNNIEIDGDLNHDGAGVGFYATAPVAKQLAVPVTAAGIHAALVNLGLIT